MSQLSINIFVLLGLITFFNCNGVEKKERSHSTDYAREHPPNPSKMGLKILGLVRFLFLYSIILGLLEFMHFCPTSGGG